MTASEFAANFRAAMALAEPPRVPSHVAAKMLALPERYADWTPQQEHEAQMLTSRLAAWGWPRSTEEPISLPTPEEISAIAAALGCPEERLTVSREELERRWKEACRQLYHHEHVMRNSIAHGVFDEEHWKQSPFCQDSTDPRFLQRRIRQQRIELDRFHRGERGVAAGWQVYRDNLDLKDRVAELEAELAEARERTRKIIEG